MFVEPEKVLSTVNIPRDIRWRTRSQFPDDAAILRGVLPSQFLEFMLHPKEV